MSRSVAESKENGGPQKNGSALDAGCAGNFKTGQRYPTPSPGSGDRVFYETLLEQNPSSEMAQDWCVMYGVLDEQKAAQLYHKILNRKVKKKDMNSPAAMTKKRPLETTNTAKGNTAKPRKIRDDDDVIGDTGIKQHK